MWTAPGESHGNLERGMHVRVGFREGDFDGTVAAVHPDGYYDVEFDDGNDEDNEADGNGKIWKRISRAKIKQIDSEGNEVL